MPPPLYRTKSKKSKCLKLLRRHPGACGTRSNWQQRGLAPC